MPQLTVQQMKDQLEALIDEHNLTSVLQALAHVCSDKHQHVLENWQDPTTARHWSQAAWNLETEARKAHNRTGERNLYE